MIFGSLVIYQQLKYVLKKDLGFNKEQVLTFHLESGKVREQVAALKTQLLQSPLIAGAAVAGNPIGNNNIGSSGFWFDTGNNSKSKENVGVQKLMIDADFLPTLEIKLMKGRNFGRELDQYQSMLINETLMKRLGLQNPIGKKAQFVTNDKNARSERTIIGVVKDFHTYSLQHKIEPMALLMPPVANMQDNMYVKIQPGHTAAALTYLQQVYKQFDANNPLEIHFLDQNFAQQYAAEKKHEKVLLLFTVLAVFISGLGLFGLSAFTAAQRTKEIGIRKVLGASVSGIAFLLSKDFLKLVLLANLLAWPIAWYGMQQWLQHFAYRTNISWWIFALAGLTAIVIALLTVSIQALKAALANPVKALRDE